MLPIGQTLTLNGRDGIVCFDANYNNKYYVNINFDDDNDYKIYRVDKNGENLTFTLEKDEKTITDLITIWLADGMEDLNV